MKPLYVSKLFAKAKKSPNFGQNLSKPATVFLEMVGQIIACKTHCIICPTLLRNCRTGYALPLYLLQNFMNNDGTTLILLFLSPPLVAGPQKYKLK